MHRSSSPLAPPSTRPPTSDATARAVWYLTTARRFLRRPRTSTCPGARQRLVGMFRISVRWT
eukprot:14779-Eustigmatos_ZCMA.PRE.1